VNINSQLQIILVYLHKCCYCIGIWLFILSFKWDILLWWRFTELNVLAINNSMYRVFVIDSSLIFLSFSQMISYLCYTVYTGVEELVFIYWFIHSSFTFHSFISFTHLSTSFMRIKHETWLLTFESNVCHTQRYRYGINNCPIDPLCVQGFSTAQTLCTWPSHEWFLQIIRNNGLGSRATYIGILSLNVVIT
jgi:hypothetical protein